ncbi:phage head closure protein [Anaerotignum sp.]|uniref:phage head closure protein n=1 Tax=Anaerotignum sp. TaxID=2039241 RepID=UPI00332BD237
MVKKLKDKKIELFKKEYIEDDIGQQRLVLSNITPSPIWAYFRQLSGQEYFAAASTQATEEVLFTINWRNDIDTYIQVKFRGKFYNITRIDSFEGNKTDLNLYCKLGR